MDQLVKRLLRIAIVGAPNAGKSTLLNRLVCNEISCVSNKVHTTRRNILGVYTHNDVQLEFYDSPGVITREHQYKHRLEDSVYLDPDEAAHKCDLIAVVADAGNIREQRRLNKGIVSMLNQHQDKKSILVLNKVDLIKEKRLLLDISTRLTQGCLEDRCTFSKRDLRSLSTERLRDLNLEFNLLGPASKEVQTTPAPGPKLHQYVIELKPRASNDGNSIDLGVQNSDPKATLEQQSYRGFSHVFSISALKDEGVDQLREYLFSQAQPVSRWPHGPLYVTNQKSRELVHSIIRGHVMDETKHSVPYEVGYHYQRFEFDEMGSLHINLSLRCPQKYMVRMLVGERGATIVKILDSSRASISRVLARETRLDISVDYSPDARSKVTFARSNVPEYQKIDESKENQHQHEQLETEATEIPRALY